MKLVIKSDNIYFNKRFIDHLIRYFRVLIFTQDNIRKMSYMDDYLLENFLLRNINILLDKL